MKVLEIEVPLSSCEVSPLHILPFTNDERYRTIVKAMHDHSWFPLPMVRPRGGVFEVIKNWDVIYEAREKGLEKIRVQYADFSDGDVIAYGIVQQAEDLELHWLDLARALLKAKRALKWSDLKIAKSTEILGSHRRIDRTKVARLTKIATGLTPRLQRLAESGVLSFTSCRKLVTLLPSRQLELAAMAVEKALPESRLLDLAFPRSLSSSNSDTKIGNDLPVRKATDILRAEVKISEKVGFPVEICNLSGQANGRISYEFFSKNDLIAIVNKVVRSADRRAVFKGKISFSFDGLDDFDLLTQSYFSHED